MKKIFAIFFMTMMFAKSAFAANVVVSDLIDQEVQNYVDAIFDASGSDIFLFVTAILTFLFFMCLVGEIVKFINGNADWIAILTLVILYISTTALIASYGPFTHVIKGVFEDLCGEFQYLIIGSRDKMFLSDFIDKVIKKAVQAPDVGFTDSIFMWGVTLVWGVVSLLLQVAFYLADTYVTLGYALARVVGVLFVPFLIAPWTRPIFDGWVKFFVGFGICGILLRLTCILAMLVMKATINAAGKLENPASALINSNYDVKAPLVVADNNISLLLAIIAFGVISCVMVFSSFGFAKTLASGVGSASNAATNMAKSAAVKAMAALI